MQVSHPNKHGVLQSGQNEAVDGHSGPNYDGVPIDDDLVALVAALRWGRIRLREGAKSCTIHSLPRKAL